MHTKLLKPLQVCGRKNWLTERCETNWLKACGFRGWLWNSIPSIKRKQCSLSGWKTLYAWSFIEYFGEYFNSKQRRKITSDVRKSLRIAMNFLCCLRIIFSNPLRDEFCTFFVCFCFFVVVAATRWNVKICKNDIAFFTDPILNCFWIFHVANTWSQWKKIIFSQVGFFRAFSHFAGIFQCCNLRNFLSQRRYFISRGNLFVLKFLEFFFWTFSHFSDSRSLLHK